ncbi:uncharacterized protein LOC131649821 [Vicia villosa]|uniref:uncharacterized protein LOC131649821 n=1 Tax=Vicia villosa TaxID=3911 RepID=UPI00273B8CC2|nr:uncharacterized protein LOC131649821 [Vicia villosa]
MSRPIEPLKEINDSKDLWKIAVRCKHLWTVTSYSNKEHMKMVLVDYKKAEFPDIPHNYLNIIGLNSIVEGRFQSNVLVDLIGGITDITQTQVNGDNSKNKIVFSIVDVSKTVVQYTLWGQLAVQLYEYYKNNKQAFDIVILLMNARVKEAQGGFPVSVSNTWNGTKLLINDLAIEEVKSLKERLGVDLPLLSSSSVQVEATQKSFHADYDKFVWKAKIMSLSEITNLQHVGKINYFLILISFLKPHITMGWYYDGCVECKRSVTAKDGKLKCFKEHISPESVPRYKLDITAVDGSSKAKFVFWDTDCVKLIGKSALQMKMDLTQSNDYDPLEFPYELDSILKKELAIRAVYQPKNGRLSVVGFKTDKDVRNKIKESFKFEEEPVSASAEMT